MGIKFLSPFLNKSLFIFTLYFVQCPQLGHVLEECCLWEVCHWFGGICSRTCCPHLHWELSFPSRRFFYFFMEHHIDFFLEVDRVVWWFLTKDGKKKTCDWHVCSVSSFQMDHFWILSISFPLSKPHFFNFEFLCAEESISHLFQPLPKGPRGCFSRSSWSINPCSSARYRPEICLNSQSSQGHGLYLLSELFLPFHLKKTWSFTTSI